MAIQKVDTVGNLTSLANLFTSKKGTSTTTTGTDISAEGINALIAQIMGGANGLASVAGGQKSAGLYNSTTNEQLVNDLTSRTAGEVAKASAKTTTTTNQKQAPAMDPMKTILNLAGNQLIKAGLKKTGISGKFDEMTKSIFGGGGSVDSGGIGSVSLASGNAGVASSVGSAGFSSAAISDMGISLSGLDALGSLGASITDFAPAMSIADFSGTTAATFGGESLGAGAGSSIAGEGVSGMSSLGATGWGALAAYGALDLSQDLERGDGTVLAADAIGGLGTGDIVQAMQTGNINDAAGPLGAMWIICTELVKQNRLPKSWYSAGAKVFAAYPEIGKRGYYVWAIPSVAHLRANPKSAYSNFLCRIFNWRAENIAAHHGIPGARKLWRGAAVTTVLYPICIIIGSVVWAGSLVDWKRVYA